jgi:SM-20-related protein
MGLGSVIDFKTLGAGQAHREPYPYVYVQNIIADAARSRLRADFPDISRAGFFPLSEMKVAGAFAELIDDISSDPFAAILSDKLGLDLSDKPRLITVRKWSAAKDGRIHNDGEAKIATALIYLNENWAASGKGCFRVLNGAATMDDFACEVPPLLGTLVAFRRTENSWHGHPPFVGERRVVQMAYLRSQADLERKSRRGRWSLFLKKLNPFQAPSMFSGLTSFALRLSTNIGPVRYMSPNERGNTHADFRHCRDPIAFGLGVRVLVREPQGARNSTNVEPSRGRHTHRMRCAVVSGRGYCGDVRGAAVWPGNPEAPIRGLGSAV